MSSSSSMSSSSFAKRTTGQPLCCCGVKATLKFSTTAKNPGRPFLGCPKYNTEGLPFCKFFQWADHHQVTELQLQERINDLLQREKDLSKIVDLLEKRENDLRRMVDHLEKELLRQTQEPDMKREHKLGKHLCGIALVVLLICIGRWLLY
ncbi:uncharacterized protein LOC122305777 [Carya illinoinensis]|uniref:uncharacterized protein LOC122294656 n=1 Tax=Carya illinoinensis TaxID=32201 RepID=UPI001C726C11|nr:uncharacterized protein LOC122294656 [Carya illinoinensis]XP_042974260.1 uncharacterized protein LOC122305777 [Carya illinoinensis]